MPSIWHGSAALKIEPGLCTFSAGDCLRALSGLALCVMGDPGYPACGDFSRLVRAALDVLMPPRCLCCGGVVSELGTLCPSCWAKIRFITPPLCAHCGLPFEIDLGTDALCASCAANPPHYERARAVFLYDEASRGLVLRFKHADRTGAAPYYARWMKRAGAALLAEADLVVPVPLHRWRLLHRRYNQAALLALSLSRACDVAASADALVRLRDTPSQGRGGRLWRHRNVKGAFSVARTQAVAGKRVLLVDDVLTTGATLDECARTLLSAGAKAVDVLTLARVGPADLRVPASNGLASAQTQAILGL